MITSSAGLEPSGRFCLKHTVGYIYTYIFIFIFNVLSCSQYAHLFCIGCSLVFQSQSQNCTSASTVIWILWIFWGGNFGFL